MTRRRRRRRRFAAGVGVGAASAVSVLAALGIVATWPESTPAAPVLSPSADGISTTIATAGATPSPTPARTHTTSARHMRTELTRALDRYLDDRPGQLTLSVRDLSTGLTFTYRPKARIVTASIVKVDILSALLLQAQRAERHLTATERALATRMIEDSDNNAANALWYAAGGSAGVAAANRKLRLRSTSPGPGGYWGSTTTSAADQIRILSALTSTHSPLTAGSRDYILDLMSHVTSAQAWGISAAADGDDAVAIKNGWLPRAADDGRWTVNSIGRVRGDGHDFLIAVLSTSNVSMGAGIEMIEHATRLVTATLRKAAESG